MPGTGGFRKIRWEDSRRGNGKRGGLRVIYYYLTTDQQIWFFTLYDKNEATDFSHPRPFKTHNIPRIFIKLNPNQNHFTAINTVFLRITFITNLLEYPTTGL